MTLAVAHLTDTLSHTDICSLCDVAPRGRLARIGERNSMLAQRMQAHLMSAGSVPSRATIDMSWQDQAGDEGMALGPLSPGFKLGWKPRRSFSREDQTVRENPDPEFYVR